METIFHVLVECGFAGSCWNLSVLSSGTNVTEFSTWFSSISATSAHNRWRRRLWTVLDQWKTAQRHKGRYGFCYVVRDHDGCLIEVVVGSRVGCVQLELAEVLGVMKEVLSWIKRKSLSEVVIESDA
uniref:RNase H type-1 domain-containing protein n=1 Tax=Cannabis sativa TaxID=3483 RepID=A0A803PVN7_CANSA